MWKSKLILDPDDRIEHVRHVTKGFMGETDVDTYSIVKADGTPAGSVTVEDHTAVKGFQRTIRVTQTDVNGAVVVSTSLSPK